MSSATFDDWRRILESLPIVEKTPYDFAVYPLDRTLSHIKAVRDSLNSWPDLQVTDVAVVIGSSYTHRHVVYRVGENEFSTIAVEMKSSIDRPLA